MFNSLSTEEVNSRYLLFGGFGNQLFQISKAISETAHERATMVRHFKSAREELDLSLDAFILPPQVEIVNTHAPGMFVQKIINLGLRLSAGYQFSMKKIPMKMWTINWLSRLIGLLIKENVVFNLGVGLDIFENRSKRGLNIGYFQFQPNPETLKQLSRISLRAPSEQFISMLKESRKVKFVAVHIRLGDYYSDHSIGVLAPEYFKIALRDLLLEEKFEAVYIFSNDIQKAKGIILPDTHQSLIFVGEDCLVPAEAFELMRGASGYVISNSTFSWWASVLSYSENPRIVCPSPWFRGLQEPIGLIPNHWQRLSSNFQQGSHR